MVCIPCIVIPVLLWVYKKFLEPYVYPIISPFIKRMWPSKAVQGTLATKQGQGDSTGTILGTSPGNLGPTDDSGMYKFLEWKSLKARAYYIDQDPNTGMASELLALFVIDFLTSHPVPGLAPDRKSCFLSCSAPNSLNGNCTILDASQLCRA